MKELEYLMTEEELKGGEWRQVQQELIKMQDRFKEFVQDIGITGMSDVPIQQWCHSTPYSQPSETFLRFGDGALKFGHLEEREQVIQGSINCWRRGGPLLKNFKDDISQKMEEAVNETILARREVGGLSQLVCRIDHRAIRDRQ